MYQKLEGLHVVFLKHIPGQRVICQRDGTWRCVAEENFLKKAVTEYIGAYIEKQQATVVKWVALQPILEVYNKKTGYK